jgi:hypothetical protein
MLTGDKAKDIETYRRLAEHERKSAQNHRALSALAERTAERYDAEADALEATA